MLELVHGLHLKSPKVMKLVYGLHPRSSKVVKLVHGLHQESPRVMELEVEFHYGCLGSELRGEQRHLEDKSQTWIGDIGG